MIATISNTFFFLLLVPHVSPLPTESDIQPMFIIAGFLLLFTDKVLLKNKIKYDCFDLFFLGIGFISLLYFSSDGTFVLKKQVGLLASFLIYYIYKYYKHHLKKQTLYAALGILIIGAILQFYFPSHFYEISINIMHNIRYNPEQGRGLTSFTTEPAFLSASLSVIGFILVDYKSKFRLRRKNYALLMIVIITMLLLTKSFLSLILIIFLLYEVIKSKVSFAFFFAILFSSLILFNVGKSSDNRAISVVNKAISGEIFLDHSIAQRLSNLNTALFTLQNNPIGYGAGSFRGVSEMSNNASNITYHSGVDHGMIVSSFSRLVVELSYFFLLFVFFLYMIKHRKAGVGNRLASFLMLFVTFPVVFPGIWILLLLNLRENNAIK